MIRQYIVDAFTDKLFKGNPAAVCVCEDWLDEKLMMSIAAENNLSETAFIVKEESDFRLRWFTPTCEVGLCGHATLASGFVMLNYVLPSSLKGEETYDSVTFNTVAGKLKVSRKNGMYELLFPNITLENHSVTNYIVKAIGTTPAEVLMGKDLDLICVLNDADQVKSFIPDPEKLKKLPGRMVHLTAPGTDGFDCCSRCFGPKIGILEDPVCGSAHCQIIPYWSKRLGKTVINAWEASARGGSLQGEIIDNQSIVIRGKAILFAQSVINESLNY